MKTRVFLFTIFTISLVALATWLTILFDTSPTNREVMIVFYGSLFVTLSGIIFALGYWWSFWRSRTLPSWYQTVSYLRLGALAASLVVVMLALKANQLLTLSWTLVLVVIAVIAELVWRKRTLTN